MPMTIVRGDKVFAVKPPATIDYKSNNPLARLMSLLETIDPQPTGPWPPTTILEAIYRVTGHLQLHQGQIILLTKHLTGADLDLSIPRKR